MKQQRRVHGQMMTMMGEMRGRTHGILVRPAFLIGGYATERRDTRYAGAVNYRRLTHASTEFDNKWSDILHFGKTRDTK